MKVIDRVCSDRSAADFFGAPEHYFDMFLYVLAYFHHWVPVLAGFSVCSDNDDGNAVIVSATSGETTRRREETEATSAAQRTQREAQEQEEKEDDVKQRVWPGVEFEFWGRG